MSDVVPEFLKSPIVNSPYCEPERHWDLDDSGQPTGKIVEGRRGARFITAIPQSKKQKAAPQQKQMVFDEGKGLSDEDQRYNPEPFINELRVLVDRWHKLPDPATWHVTPETQRLLEYWRTPRDDGFKPFFCQVEAVETVIWLTEVAPHLRDAKRFIEHLELVNGEANPGLLRLALKLATGSGKTTVMAMLIAWQTINSVRRPQSPRFTRAFLIVTPGITIKDRLRVLDPHDASRSYQTRGIVPSEFLMDVDRALVVITNYHAFKLREEVGLSKGGRALLQGHGPELKTLETPGKMISRVMGELMRYKNILVLNDEAHHCYREKRKTPSEPALKGEERKEAEENAEAARVWISGLEMVANVLGIARVIDLSATPFFLSGSGYREGTLFPWTMCDFALMDAIECGIVKLPRVPIADNANTGDAAPMYRELWKHVGKDLPKGKASAKKLDPNDLPMPLQSAIEALYGHYAKTHEAWIAAGITVPPCFIVVCQNTAISKLVYDYLAGYDRTLPNGNEEFVFGRHELFRNTNKDGNPLARPNTILIDSAQLESGDTLEVDFRKDAAPEIARFTEEVRRRGGVLAERLSKGGEIDDATLLREVMNTVGKRDGLGEQVRCVVSVSMLTEGWDANTVTHVLGVRAFGTQLLCEQVIGRALRRQSYDLGADGLFAVEYADVLGIPFDFTAKPVPPTPATPRQTTQVRAMRPERDALEIRFPRVSGYQVELPRLIVEAAFNPESKLTLTPELTGATETTNAGIIGEHADLTMEHLAETRRSTIKMKLTVHLLKHWHAQYGDDAAGSVYGDLSRVVGQWLDEYLECKGSTFPAQILHAALADRACVKILDAINRRYIDDYPIRVLLDPYAPVGSTSMVNFLTTKSTWKTEPARSHINYVVSDSGWEDECARAIERHPRVRSYVKNQGLSFEVPYLMGTVPKRYLPDFIVRIDDGHGDADLLNLIVEIKGYRHDGTAEKKAAMKTYWIPGVNALGTFGRWAFLELTEVHEIQSDFIAEIERRVKDALASVGAFEAAEMA